MYICDSNIWACAGCANRRECEDMKDGFVILCSEYKSKKEVEC
jgi:hypothetical protein